MICADWRPLSDGDPIPGDPEAVRLLADRYERSAQDVGSQVLALRRLAAGPGSAGGPQWQGAAARAYAARADRLPVELDRVGARFLRVARSLRQFAPALESAQRRARSALQAARAALAADAAQAGEAGQAGQAGQVSAVVQPAPALSVGLGLPLRPAESPDLQRARRMLAAACAERDRAAERCARALAAAGHDELRNPSGWSRLLGAVSSWAGSCSAWLGVAAVLLCWVPGVGQVLGAVSLSLALVALAADLGLAASGGQGWSAVGVDLLGVLPLGKAARTGAVMSRAVAVERAAQRAGSSLRAPAALGRGLQRLSPEARFERTRGLHGLAALPSGRPGHAVVHGARDLRVAVRSATRPRDLAGFLRSPGGLLDDIARARGQGPGGSVWLAGGHGLDTLQTAVGVQTSRQPVGAA